VVAVPVAVRAVVYQQLLPACLPPPHRSAARRTLRRPAFPTPSGAGNELPGGCGGRALAREGPGHQDIARKTAAGVGRRGRSCRGSATMRSSSAADGARGRRWTVEMLLIFTLGRQTCCPPTTTASDGYAPPIVSRRCDSQGAPRLRRAMVRMAPTARWYLMLRARTRQAKEVERPARGGIWRRSMP